MRNGKNVHYWARTTKTAELWNEKWKKCAILGRRNILLEPQSPSFTSLLKIHLVFQLFYTHSHPSI